MGCGASRSVDTPVPLESVPSAMNASEWNAVYSRLSEYGFAVVTHGED